MSGRDLAFALGGAIALVVLAAILGSRGLIEINRGVRLRDVAP